MLDPQFGMNWAEMDVRTSGSATTIQNTKKELQKSLTDSLIAQAKKVDLDICEEPTEPTQDSPPNAKIPRLLAKVSLEEDITVTVDGSHDGRRRSRRAAFPQTAGGQEVWRPDSDDRDQDPLPRDGQSKLHNFLTLVKVILLSQAHGTKAKENSDDGRPSTSSRHTRRDSSPCFTSSSAWSSPWSSPPPETHVERMCRESLSLSSRGSYCSEWRWSGDGSESPKQQGLSRSDSLEGFLCPPLPGQVPVEPTETSTGRTAQGAVEASPVNQSSTESFESFYNVEKMIGSGGYGKVFLGTRKFDGKKVAIKRMRKIDNDLYLNIPGNPELLVTEVALLMMMRRESISPFVIQLYQWFEEPRGFTLVMEYPEPCERLLDSITRDPWNDRFSQVVMRQAVQAVQHCIHHGVFHNDIHSQNFLLKKDTLELKLIDFGCGQLFSSEGYESNIYKGVPDYCPPEVLTEPRFHAVPANVWSLGVLIVWHEGKAYMVYANSGSMKCFECGDVSDKRMACPHKAQNSEEAAGHGRLKVLLRHAA
ncbi:unnamed protein product [Leuciscus chuanchicus]